jgi:hypothetical protein
MKTMCMFFKTARDGDSSDMCFNALSDVNAHHHFSKLGVSAGAFPSGTKILGFAVLDEEIHPQMQPNFLNINLACVWKFPRHLWLLWIFQKSLVGARLGHPSVARSAIAPGMLVD